MLNSSCYSIFVIYFTPWWRSRILGIFKSTNRHKLYTRSKLIRTNFYFFQYIFSINTLCCFTHIQQIHRHVFSRIPYINRINILSNFRVATFSPNLLKWKYSTGQRGAYFKKLTRLKNNSSSKKNLWKKSK